MTDVGVEIRILYYVMRYQAYLFVCTSDPGGTGGCTQYIAVLQFSTIPEPYSLWPTGLFSIKMPNIAYSHIVLERESSMSLY